MELDVIKNLWDDLSAGDLVTSKGLEPADGFTSDNPCRGLVLEFSWYKDSRAWHGEDYVTILWDNGLILDYDVDSLSDPHRCLRHTS